jgi:hypothetical protein
MTAPVDAKAIARGLTKAQRRTLLDSLGSNIVYARRQRTIHALAWADILTTLGDWSLKGNLTPLGLAVRAHLTQEQPR